MTIPELDKNEITPWVKISDIDRYYRSRSDLNLLFERGKDAIKKEEGNTLSSLSPFLFLRNSHKMQRTRVLAIGAYSFAHVWRSLKPIKSFSYYFWEVANAPFTILLHSRLSLLQRRLKRESINLSLRDIEIVLCFAFLVSLAEQKRKLGETFNCHICGIDNFDSTLFRVESLLMSSYPQCKTECYLCAQHYFEALRQMIVSRKSV